MLLFLVDLIIAGFKFYLNICVIIVFILILYIRWSLCCKSGEEMALMFRPENKHYEYVIINLYEQYIKELLVRWLV